MYYAHSLERMVLVWTAGGPGSIFLGLVLVLALNIQWYLGRTVVGVRFVTLNGKANLWIASFSCAPTEISWMV